MIKKHINVALFLAWLIGFLLFYWCFAVIKEEAISSLIIMLAVVFIFGAEMWFLNQKKRSYWHLMWNLLSVIGLIVLLFLENRSVIFTSPSSNLKVARMEGRESSA